MAAAGVAGAWLYLDRPFDGWILISADGLLQVAVDGHWIHQRETSHRRGHGFVPIALTLDVGFHPLLIALERQGNRSGLRALLRERNTNQAPAQAQIYLPGAPNREKLYAQLADLTLRVSPSRSPVGLDVELAFPASVPAEDLPIEIALKQRTNALPTLWQVGRYHVENARHKPFRFHIAPLDAFTTSDVSTLVVRFGPSSIERPIWLLPEAIASLDRTNQVALLAAPPNNTPTRFDDVRATLEAHWAGVAEGILRPSRTDLADSIHALHALDHVIEIGGNPFRQPGYVHASIRSPFDGRPSAVLTHVPTDLLNRPAVPRPLVAVLHGYNSNPKRILDAFLDSASPNAKTPISGFVIAPHAYGNSFYRGPGENAVLDAINWALSTFPIDESRISITGVSMGGTGAAEIALKHSEMFAAAAPLCGYHSYFVRRDTANKPLRPWERRLMHHFSPASFAEAGRDLPLFVAHGTKDFPLENSKVLTHRYRELGYNLTEDWPNLGHAVWKKTYRDGAMYWWLSKWQKDKDPKEVVLASTSPNGARKFWLEITHLEDVEEPGVLDARFISPVEVNVRSKGVLSFRIGATRHLDDSTTITVNIDGTALSLESGVQRRFLKVNHQWQLDHSSAQEVRQGTRIVGPWSELFAAPVAVVYGTLDPRTAALNREVALRLVEPRPGVDLTIPSYADRDFSPAQSHLTRLIYVGTPRDHIHYAKLQAALPIRVTPSAIEVGSLRFTEPDVGVAFVYPDPDRRERLLGIVSGNGPEGLWRALALPALLPDFVVFDHAVDAAAGEPVLGTNASLRAAGFFRSDWSLPDNPLDPFAPKPR